MGDKTTPNPFFWPFLTPGVVLCHPGVVLSPLLQGWVYPLKGVVLSPYLVIEGVYHCFGVVLSPIFGDFIPLLAGGGGRLAHLNVNQETHSRKTGCFTPPPPRVPRNRLVQEPTPVSAVEFSHNLFYHWVLGFVAVGQLFCAGHHFMCVAAGPPIKGDPISHSQAHTLFKPLPLALDHFPEATSPWQETNKSQLKRRGH